MKKFLSVLLAVVMVFSTIAFAAPSVVTVSDTAEEKTAPADGEADLMGAGYKVMRGINMVTGTKDALTGENWATFGGLFNTAYGDTTLSAADDPKGEKGKVIKFNIPSPAREDRTGDYVNFRLQFGWNGSTRVPLSNYIDHTYMYVAFDVMKEVVDESLGYKDVNAAWLMNSSVSSSSEAFHSFGSTLTPSVGWMHYGKVVNLTWSNQDPDKSTTITDPTELIFHAEVDNANGTDVNFYFDNMYFAPAYKVTYYNKAGTQVVKEDYIAVDAAGNLLTSFEPKSFLEGGSTYSGWSLTQGGTPVSSIELNEANNADIVLYATEEIDAFEGASIVLSGKLTKVGQTVTAEAALSGAPDMDADYITWSSSDITVLSATKNKDGSATLKALKEGSSTVTYTYSKDGVTKSLSKNVVVATEPITEFSGNALGIDLDTYEYLTLNVTNTSGSAQTVSVRCRITVDGTTSTVNIPVEVPAGASNMDVYVDLTENESWNGTLASLTISASAIPDGVTVNNKKLWAKLATEVALAFTTESTFIGTPNSTLNVGAVVDCDLEGVYDTSYTWDYDVTNNCATVEESADGSLNITVGENKEGFVTVTAISGEDESVSITKRIFVKTGVDDGSKAIAYTWNLNDTAGTNNWHSGGGHHSQSKLENGTLTMVRTAAKLTGASSTTAVSTTASGSGYTLASTGSGSYSESGNNSTEFVMSDYPYFCIKAKTDNPGTYSVKLYITTDGVSHHESRAKTFSFDLTDEYQVFALDYSSIANSTELKGKNYGSLMFVNLTDSVIDASTISNNVASSPLTYTSYKPIIIDEIFFANYDASDNTEIGVNLTADKTSLTGEGTFTLTSEVFSNKAIASSGVLYTADSDIVTVFNNGDGTATVTPVGNGTVTITAKSVVDENATDSVTLTISGVQKKLVAYDLSMVSLGNSYLHHGYAEWFDKSSYNGWIDETDVTRGMAASEPDLDYYGRIQYYINQNFNCSLTAERFANNLIEIAWKKGLANQSDASNHEGFDYTKAKNAILDAMTAQLAYIEKNQTNIITIQLFENAQFGSYAEIASFFYDTVFTAIDEVRPEESVVVVITPFGSSAASNAQILKAQEFGYYVANCTDMTDRKWQAYDQYPNFSNPNAGNDFRSHPGDLGMDEIGKRVFAQLESAVPATISASYIYVPESISITGGNAITEDEGTLQLSVVAEPSENSTTNVVWSVDNDNVATIDENGLLTAVNNGTVNVTATCAYDSTVKATLAVTVSGQMEAFTLTYAGGTTDTVTNLPAADPYAKGEYTLSTSAPERNGYKFKGWSLTAGGTPVKTVTMDANKTVYAVWEHATAWEFNTEGDLEGISFGGFHTYVRYEELPAMVVGTVTSYGDGVTVFDTTLLIDSASYNEFVVKLQPTVTTASDVLNLTITSTSGTYNYSVPLTSTAMTEYSFDISDVEGTITGFLLKPSVVELSLYVDYIRFQKGTTRVTVTEDTTVANLAVNADTKISAVGATYTVTGAVNVAADATLYLEAGGTYVFKGGLAGNVVASPNANVIVEGSAPEGYVEINLGARLDASNVRYAEIGGNQYEIREYNDLYGVIASENMLVQIVEVNNAASLASDETYVAEDVLTSYYHVDASSKEYEELPMGNYMKNIEGQDLRLPAADTDNKPGVRFKAQITTASKKASDYTITEYGYIIGLEETLEANGEQLNFNASNYASGKAYIRGNQDKVFDSSIDGIHVFTGVLYGAPEDSYGKNLVSKTYTKVTIGENNYVIYGEPVVANFYDIAKTLDEQGGLSDEAQAIVDNILEKTLGPDIGFDWGEL